MAGKPVILHLDGFDQKNNMQNSPGAKISAPVTINVPPPPLPEDAFKTSLTVVRWPGLDADASRAVIVHSGAELANAHLPRLATRRVKLAFDSVLGIYALQIGRHSLGGAFLDSLKSSSAGVDGSYELYRMAGKSLVIRGQVEQGLAFLQHAYNLCKSTNLKCQSETQYRLGWAYDRLSQAPEAFKHYESARKLAQQYRNYWIEGSALHGIGHIHAVLGDKRKGHEECDRARLICKRAKAWSCEAESLSCLGSINAELGELFKAKEQLEHALAIFEKENNPGGEAAVREQLGRLHVRQREDKQAHTQYVRALRSFELSGDLRGKATVLNELGYLAETSKDVRQAKDLYEKAIKTAKDAQEPRLEASVLANLERLRAAIERKY